MKTGIQVSSLKPLLTTSDQVRSAFARMGRMGQPYLQLQWIDPSVPIPVIAECMAENGQISLGVQDFYEIVAENLAYYVNLNAATGGKYITVSRIPEKWKSREGLACFALALWELQASLPAGQELLLHPVSADYRAVPGMNAVEYLLEKLPWLKLCLDLYHLDRCCDDMPGFLRKYRGRLVMVHFKDGIGDNLVPAGQGTVNWQGVVEACLETGVGYGLAEQERWDGDPYVCLEQALEWLERQMEIHK